MHVSNETRRAMALELLSSRGIGINAIRDALGFKNRSNANEIMSQLVREGLAFGFKRKVSSDPECRSWETVYYKTATDRDLAQADRREFIRAAECARKRTKEYAMQANAARAARRKAQRQATKALREQQNAERRALRAAAAELAKQKARQDKEAKAAERERRKAEAASQRARLKAETKAAGVLPKIKGTKTPAATRVTGPAHLGGELDMSRAKVFKAAPMPERWATNDVPPLFSSLRPGQYIAPAPAWIREAA